MRIREQIIKDNKVLASSYFNFSGTLKEYARREVSYPWEFNDKTQELIIYKLDGRTKSSVLSEYWEELEVG
jgi:hypothetical protein